MALTDILHNFISISVHRLYKKYTSMPFSYLLTALTFSCRLHVCLLLAIAAGECFDNSYAASLQYMQQSFISFSVSSQYLLA